MVIKKRILFRMASMDRSCKAEELINIIKNMDDEQFEVSILLDYYEGDLIKDIPADIEVMSLVKGRRNMSKNSAVFLFQLIYRQYQILLYRRFPSRIKGKIRRVPDIEVAFALPSLKGLLNSPFKDSGKICWYHADLKYQYTPFYTKRLFRMMRRCNIAVFDSLYTLKDFENDLGAKVLRSRYIHPYINKSKVLEQSSQQFLQIEEQFSGSEKIFVSVGSLTHDKGYDALLTAHAELLSEGFAHKVMIL